MIIWTPSNLAQSSAQTIQSALNTNGMSATIVSDISSTNLQNYSSVYICLGIYPNNYTLQDGDDVDKLVDYLNNGGRLYMEGGDTWARDYPTDLHAYFNVLGEADGTDDLSAIIGHSCLDGYEFSYNGPQNYIDHLAPLDGSTLFFSNEQPGYGTGVAYDHGTYKTLAVSFEFGGLADGDYSKNELMGDILAFFDNGCSSSGPAPFNLQAFSGYDHAVPLMWDAPVGQTTLSVDSIELPRLIHLQNQKDQPYISSKNKERAVYNAGSLAKSSLYQAQSFNIYRSTSPGGPYRKVASNIERQYYRDAPVNNAATFYYVVTANYSSGESEYSQEVNATPQADGFKITSTWINDDLNIDGVISPSEWSDATIVDIRQEGESEPVYLYLLNNQDYLYIGIDDVNNQNAAVDDQVGVYIDRDLNGEWSDNLALEGNFWFPWNGSQVIDLLRLLDGWWPERIEWDDPAATDLSQSAGSNASGHLQYEIQLALQDIDIQPDMTLPLNSFIYSLDMPDSVFSAAWPSHVLNSPWNNAWLASVLYGTIELSGERECPIIAQSQNITTPGLYSFSAEADGHQVDVQINSLIGSDEIRVTQYNCVYPNLPGADYLPLYWTIEIGDGISNLQADYSFHYTDEDADGFQETEGFFGMAWFDENANTWQWKAGSVDAANNIITIENFSTAGSFVLYRRIFGDATGDGYVDEADLQLISNVWLFTSGAEFANGSTERFFNFNKNVDGDGNQIIDEGDLQIFSNCWLNGIEP